jgi:phospholipid transport system substrate-binding protein
MQRCVVRVAAAVLMIVVGVGVAWAGAPTEQVRQYTDQVVKILENPELRSADKRAAVRKAAIEIFDVNETARRALGTHWQARSASERDEFVRLFADLLERTYISKVDLFGGEQLRYTTESVDGDFAIVRAKVITKKGNEIPVEARLMRHGEQQWLIYDISVANVSLIANYRTQFDRIIRTSSYQDLVRKLRDNRDQFLNEKAAPSGRTS